MVLELQTAPTETYAICKTVKDCKLSCFSRCSPLPGCHRTRYYTGALRFGRVIHPNVTLGHRVRIFQHVTIAAETWVGSPHRVVIGDDVVIGAGACIIPSPDTGLNIGNFAQVGANAVVKQSVEPGQTVVGVPAKPLLRS